MTRTLASAALLCLTLATLTQARCSYVDCGKPLRGTPLGSLLYAQEERCPGEGPPDGGGDGGPRPDGGDGDMGPALLPFSVSTSPALATATFLGVGRFAGNRRVILVGGIDGKGATLLDYDGAKTVMSAARLGYPAVQGVMTRFGEKNSLVDDLLVRTSEGTGNVVRFYPGGADLDKDGTSLILKRNEVVIAASRAADPALLFVSGEAPKVNDMGPRLGTDIYSFKRAYMSLPDPKSATDIAFERDNAVVAPLVSASGTDGVLCQGGLFRISEGGTGPVDFRAIDPQMSCPDLLAAVDVNGDRHLDLVLGWRASGTLRIALARQQGMSWEYTLGKSLPLQRQADALAVASRAEGADLVVLSGDRLWLYPLGGVLGDVLPPPTLAADQAGGPVSIGGTGEGLLAAGAIDDNTSDDIAVYRGGTLTALLR